MGEMQQGEETEKLPIVAFLGPKASYTHQATISRFPPTTHTITPLTTIEDVFSAVQSGTASHGVVPFENSSNGSVVFTLDLFADAANRYADIIVAGEIYLPVHHCLLGRIVSKEEHSAQHELLSRLHLTDDPGSSGTPSLSGQVTPTQTQPQPLPARAKPLHDLSHIKKLYSHPQAWGQCKSFLNTYLKHAERQDVSSTSKAAELVAAEPDASIGAAAISSRLAADLNGLEILAEGIEDSEGNSTRFFILRRYQDIERETNSNSSSDPTASSSETSRYKTLISFSVPPDAPAGALADSLAVFKTHNLNLTSINTRPSGLGAWHYVFFIEIMGRKWVGETSGAVNLALKELKALVVTYRWLGSWERAVQ